MKWWGWRQQKTESRNWGRLGSDKRGRLPHTGAHKHPARISFCHGGGFCEGGSGGDWGEGGGCVCVGARGGGGAVAGAGGWQGAVGPDIGDGAVVCQVAQMGGGDFDVMDRAQLGCVNSFD